MNEMSTMPTSNALVIFDKTFTPATLFEPGKLDPLIEHVRAAVKAEDRDATTPAGRDRIKSLAYKVTRTKTTIDAAGKQLVADEKKRLAAIDAERRRVWNELENLADEIRQPVTEYENREKTRVEAHKAAVEAIGNLDFFASQPTTDEIAARLAEAEAVGVDHEEFTALATKAKDVVVGSLRAKLEASRKADAERAELERLRREAAEREQREREERAAAKAREEAEQKAREERERQAHESAEREARIKAEAEARERAAKEAAERAEREKREAEEAAKRAEEARVAAEKKAEQERAEAERRAAQAKREAEEAARERAKEAVEQERRRLEAEQRAKEEEARKREANRQHRAKVNNVAAAALVLAGLSEDAAKAAIAAIAKGAVPHVTIAY
ncbi:MAG: hypothetical protein GX567_19795 [Clostridia bacterium]|nr:hypothetical protein [Clostridia bacterium]